MIADIEAGKVGCVITKDLSRLGRNYIEAGSYIEIFFPKHNVRYIAVTDGVDSLTRQEMDITPFKNILNDMYSRDISKKVLAGRMTRSRQGKFCGGQPPLGLMRDPDEKGHLIIDPETAPVIRWIFELALDGWGCMRIASQVGPHYNNVATWRSRFLAALPALRKIETDDPGKLEDGIRAVLSDKKRPGAPSVFTPDQIMRIIDLACGNPNDFGYEVSQWSLPLLVAEIKKQGIAAQISEKSVSRFLKMR